MCHYEAAMHKIDEDNHGWYPWEFTHIVNHRGHYRKLYTAILQKMTQLQNNAVA